MLVALQQLNPIVGDIAGNEARIVAAIEDARRSTAAVIAFPELAICGYPPEDLLLREHFVADCQAALERIAASCVGIVAIVGCPERDGELYNAAAVLADGRLCGSYRKMRLPNYGVFDELRYFAPGDEPALLEVDGVEIGITVCEDDWVADGPAAALAGAGADLIINLSASPYQAGKPAERERMFAGRARDHGVAYAVCGQAGGQDELVFDGGSAFFAADGRPLAAASQFCEQQLLVALPASERRRPAPIGARALRRIAHLTTGHHGSHLPDAPAPLKQRPERAEEVYAALVCGTRDYVDKNGFPHVVLGLSGGVDSALVLLIAVDALGPGRVSAVVMPSPFSSEATQSDARALARAAGVELLELPIGGPMGAYDELLAATFSGHGRDVTEENLQARIRGNLLMALSNKFGWLVVTTGNKSELAVGYSTLYGDSAGGFAVIKDCPKTLVYELIEHRAALTVDLVPRRIIDRPPSAELRPDQTDQDSLPAYDVLDAILEGYVEQDIGRDRLIESGLPAPDVDRVLALVDRAEYKRRQNPPGIKVTSKAFGRDRRMPITNRYRG